MAALPKPDRAFTGAHLIGRGSFNRLVETCENPPKANDALKQFVIQGKKLLQRS
jgi:hypothetical protein